MTPIDDDRPVDQLDPEITPPPHLSRRVQRSLRAARLLAPSPARRAGRFALAALAVVGLIAIGVGIGMSVDGATRGRPASRESAGRLPDKERYLLLLYEGETFEDSADIRNLRTEYAEWAADLRDRGVTVVGEELGGEAVLLDEPGKTGESLAAGGDRSPPLGRLGGYFVISAVDRAEALTIAASCPHLAHGGRIVVRSIVPTHSPATAEGAGTGELTVVAGGGGPDAG